MKLIDNRWNYYQITGVYGIRNKMNDRWYVGSASSLHAYKGIGGRLGRHLWELKRGTHHNPHLQNAYNLYGKDAFEFYVVEECGSDVVLERERFWFFNLGKELYNIAPDTGHPGGIPWTEKQREKLSGENHWLYGKNHTEETKQSISESRKGVTAGERHHLYGVGHTDEAKKKMSESHKLLVGDKNPFYGKTHKEETKRINSEKKKQWLAENDHPMAGKEHTDETKRKQSMAKVSKPPKPGCYKGVRIQNGKYRASIYVNRKCVLLGDFTKAEEAAKNYDFYARQIYPAGVYLNFPDFDFTTFVPRKPHEVVLT